MKLELAERREMKFDTKIVSGVVALSHLLLFFSFLPAKPKMKN